MDTLKTNQNSLNLSAYSINLFNMCGVCVCEAKIVVMVVCKLGLYIAVTGCRKGCVRVGVCVWGVCVCGRVSEWVSFGQVAGVYLRSFRAPAPRDNKGSQKEEKESERNKEKKKGKERKKKRDKKEKRD